MVLSVPIPIIEDDFCKVVKDPEVKVSTITLRYLLDKRLISRHQFVLYRWACKCPECRFSLAERFVVPTVNNILIRHYLEA
jgi:hypothetical protein